MRPRIAGEAPVTRECQPARRSPLAGALVGAGCALGLIPSSDFDAARQPPRAALTTNSTSRVLARLERLAATSDRPEAFRHGPDHLGGPALLDVADHCRRPVHGCPPAE